MNKTDLAVIRILKHRLMDRGGPNVGAQDRRRESL